MQSYARIYAKARSENVLRCIYFHRQTHTDILSSNMFCYRMHAAALECLLLNFSEIVKEVSEKHRSAKTSKCKLSLNKSN